MLVRALANSSPDFKLFGILAEPLAHLVAAQTR
jgi:hypothetical protein